MVKMTELLLFGFVVLVAVHGIPISEFKQHSIKISRIDENNSQNSEKVNVARTAASYYSGELKTTSGIFQRVGSDPDDYFYFDAIQITTTVGGNYILTCDSELDTMGYLYNSIFDPSVPSTNLITYDDDSGDVDLQFEIKETLQAGRVYILVVTTHREYETGSFFVTVNGTQNANLNSINPTTSRPLIIPTTIPLISSSFSGELSTSSGIFQRVDGYDDEYYYYQAIQFKAPATGNFILTSQSDIDTMGYLYQISFDPSVPENNLLRYDDDSGDDHLQFEIESFLQMGRTYILVVTTHRDYETGQFTAIVKGIEPVHLLSYTPTTSKPLIIPTTLPTITSTYSGQIATTSGIFQRIDGDDNVYYHFEAIRVTVPTTGQYILTSDSALDTMGYLYDPTFDPSIPDQNLSTYDDDSGDIDYQFEIKTTLQAGRGYILVVTTHRPYQTGSFSVLTKGSSSVSLTSFTPTTSRPLTISTTPPPTVSSFTGGLTSSSPTFKRPSGDSTANYYYRSIQVRANKAGNYFLTSNSTLDTMGYLYDSSFDPVNPTNNLIEYDDDSGDIHLQFEIEVVLQTGKNYILVVTTHSPNEIGNFVVFSKGPDSVTFT